MKKERVVETPARVVKTPAKSKTIVDIFCDICTKKVDTTQDNRYGSGGHNCQLCGRDVCRNRDTNQTLYGAPTCYRTIDDYTDGPYDKYCIICYKLMFEKYKDQFADIEREHEMAIESLEYIIKQESLNESS